jgi:hypothetical protein
MHRIVSLGLALLLTIIGAGALIFLVFFAASWYRGWTIMAAGAVFAAGAMWLYSDLTEPPR